MSTLEEIERAIETLPPHDIEKLYTWFEEHHPLDDDDFDARISTDLQAGRLDAVIRQAREDRASGRVLPL